MIRTLSIRTLSITLLMTRLNLINKEDNLVALNSELPWQLGQKEMIKAIHRCIKGNCTLFYSNGLSGSIK